ncbi:MAG: sigma 54-interacting transcriptional regulator [Bacillota bacterium]
MALIKVEDLRASDIMKGPLQTIEGGLPAADLKTFEQLPAAFFVQGAEEIGLITPDVLSEAQDEQTAQEIMITNILPIQATASIEDIIPLLCALTGQGLILVEGDRGPVGIISVRDLIAALWNCLKIVDGRLKAVLDSVNEAVTIIDDQDNVVGWNYRAQSLYNIKSSEILGRQIGDFFTNLVATEARKLVKEYRDAYHQPCRDTHVLINATPVRVGEKVIGSVSSERDITETVYLHRELSKASSQVKKLEKAINKINGPKDPFSKIRGQSKKLKEAISMARRVAVTNASVLIRGESGTGKELFAEAIHQESSRKDHPFVVINCGAIPSTLFESELFGYSAGAFTGADRKGKPGKFEMADKGTIFLDEIGELQLDMQVKLLRVLQNRVFYRVGGREPIHIDVRVIAATNRDLERMIGEGTFRKDLYYRLNVVSLDIPSLRERKEDIVDMVTLFANEFSSLYDKEILKISPDIMALILNYSWPGNVRELRNVVERLVILAEEGTAKKEHLPEQIKLYRLSQLNEPISSLAEETERTERQMILRTLEECQGNKSQAAKALGIPRSTLYYKLKILDIKY